MPPYQVRDRLIKSGMTGDLLVTLRHSGESRAPSEALALSRKKQISYKIKSIIFDQSFFTLIKLAAVQASGWAELVNEYVFLCDDCMVHRKLEIWRLISSISRIFAYTHVFRNEPSTCLASFLSVPSKVNPRRSGTRRLFAFLELIRISTRCAWSS